MAGAEQRKRKFTAKDAEETLLDPFECPIWIDTALRIPKARGEILERLLKDDDLMRNLLGDELFRLWKERQRNSAT